MRPMLIAALAAALAATSPILIAPLIAHAAASAPIPAGPVVKIDNFTFGPAVLNVKVGTTVTWINNDDVPHAIVANDHIAFRSKVMDTDEHFSFTFTKPGDYPYFCSLHPHMIGKVVVE